MFQRILTNLKSWAIKIFLGLIALSFAVWGVGDIFRGNSDPVVASIGNIKIRASELIREYDRELKQLREMSGGQIDAEQARAFGIVESALQQIINRVSLDQHSSVFAMGVPDSLIAREIRSSPNFRNQAGEFDRRLFEYAIAQNSMDEESFIAELRSDITRTQIINSLITGIKSPNTMTEAIWKFRGEQRSAEFVIIDGTEFTKSPTPNPQELDNFHRENQQMFTKPEYRTVTYVAIQPVDLLDEIDIEEDIIRSEYEYRINEFIIPDQIDLDMVVLATEEAALRALDRINQGENFADVSIGETGLEETDLMLGLVSRKNLLPELADIAFTLLPGDISDPIESDFGWHLLKVNDVLPGHTQNFTEARNTIRESLLVDRAIDLVFELSSHFEDELAGGASLEEAARNLALPVERIEMVDVNGFNPDGEPHVGLPRMTEFLESIFKASRGADTPFVEAGGNTMYKIRVDQIIGPAVQPLDNVRKQATAAWRLKWRDDQAEKLANEFETRVLELGFANATEELELERLSGAPFTRDGSGLEFQISTETVRAIFKLKIGESTNAIKIGKGQYTIGTLRDIIPAIPMTQNSLSSLNAELQQSLQNDVVTSFQAALRGRYDLKINDRLLNNLF